MKLKNDQRGFSPIFIILLILILALVGFAGWRVWSSGRESDAPASPAPTSTEEAPAEESVEATYISPPSDAFRVVLPDGWVSGECADSPDLLFLAPTSDKLGKCQSESGGTLALSKNDGDVGHNEAYYTANAYYGGISYSAITADGIVGYKVSYTIATDDGLGYPPIGTKQVLYYFYDGISTYTISYTQFAGDPDLSATIQTLAESFDKL